MRSTIQRFGRTTPTAITVLDVGGVDDGVHQQALRVDEDMALPAADLLARVIARRIDARPPCMGFIVSSAFSFLAARSFLLDGIGISLAALCAALGRTTLYPVGLR